MKDGEPRRQQVPFEATLEAIHTIPSPVKVGAVVAVAYMLYRRTQAPDTNVQVGEIEALLEATEVDGERVSMSVSDIVAALRKAAIPGISVKARNRSQREETTLGLTNVRGFLPPDVLARLVEHFPFVQGVTEYASRRQPTQQPEIKRRLTVAQEIAQLFLENPRVAIGSTGNNLTASSNSYLIGAVLRRVVPRLALGELTLETDPGTFYGLLREKPGGVRYWSGRYYVRCEPGDSALEIDSTQRFPNLAGDVLPFVVDRVYEKSPKHA